jgi:hypothetical protein
MTTTTSWTVDRLARRVAEAVLAEHLRHHEPMDAWELARVVGEHADRVGRTDLGCDFASPEVQAAAEAVKTLAAELVSYCEFGPNPTPDAYLKACEALEKWRVRAEAAEAELNALRRSQ